MLQDKEKQFVLRVNVNKLLKSKFKGKQNWWIGTMYGTVSWSKIKIDVIG